LRGKWQLKHSVDGGVIVVDEGKQIKTQFDKFALKKVFA
jgi:hypothetical protein